MKQTESKQTTAQHANGEGASLLDTIMDQTEAQAAVRSRYIPVMSIKDAIERHKQLQAFIKELLVENEDFGIIPGTDKPTLLKPGAEKLASFFGYVPDYEETCIEDWTGETYGQPLFYYKYTCTLKKDGYPVGQGIGSANSWESKYRYRWVVEPPAGVDKSTLPTRDTTVNEFVFAIEKSETTGQYGKPESYWKQWRDAINNGTARKCKRRTKDGREFDAYEMGGKAYRVPNESFPDTINTTQKMGAKRAYIAAVLTATGASQHFTQDMEDMDGDHLPAPKKAAKEPAKKTDQKTETKSAEQKPETKPEPATVRDKALAILEPAAEQGLKALELAWGTLSRAMQKAVEGEKNRLKEEAENADTNQQEMAEANAAPDYEGSAA